MMYEPQASNRERVLIVGVAWGRVPRGLVEEHLDELERLVDTAGGEVVERAIQERNGLDPATLVGSGFLNRLAERCQDLEISSLVFDEDLTASQIRNIERTVPKEVKVLDRAAVILDIFALRARTREAQTQVELAQLTYLLPRLTRRWTHLSRQAGGIGTRGVGETQLEIDRRMISKKIAQLKGRLAVIERDRLLRRKRRTGLPTLALVGYTNAGKSSLFRRLTRADVLVEDRLFATLDPRTRRLDLGRGVTAVLVDTVGFVRKLPHDLVAPFRSTLEEASEADIVLHVVDRSHPTWEDHLRVGNQILDDLDVDSDRVMVIENKIDLLTVPHHTFVKVGGIPRIGVSATAGTGMRELKKTVRHRLVGAPGVVVLRVPLEDNDAVKRAVDLPHQVALRFESEWVNVAVRSDDDRLRRVDLCDFRVEGWS